MKDYKKNNIWLMNGDCLDRMKEIESCSIDMILTDPPYGTTACKWDSIIPLDKMWEQLKRIIKPNGAIVMTASQPFSSLLVSSNIEMFKEEIVWEKPNATGFFNAKKRHLKAHEQVIVFYNKSATYNPQITTGHKRVRAKRKPSESECYSGGKDFTEYDSTVRYPRSVQLFNRDKGKGIHPTQKPIALMEYLIKTYTDENETVLDFTMGSGSTGVAACNLNRKFIGIELDNKYFDMAKSRILEILEAV